MVNLATQTMCANYEKTPRCMSVINETITSRRAEPGSINHSLNKLELERTEGTSLCRLYTRKGNQVPKLPKLRTPPKRSKVSRVAQIAQFPCKNYKHKPPCHNLVVKVGLPCRLCGGPRGPKGPTARPSQIQLEGGQMTLPPGRNLSFLTRGSGDEPLPRPQDQVSNTTAGRQTYIGNDNPETSQSREHTAAENRQAVRSMWNSPATPGQAKSYTYLENKNKAEKARKDRTKQAKSEGYHEKQVRGQAAKQAQEEAMLKRLMEGKAGRKVTGSRHHPYRR